MGPASHWVRPLQPSTAPTHCPTAPYPLQHFYNTLQHSTVYSSTYSSTAVLQSTTSTTPLWGGRGAARGDLGNNVPSGRSAPKGAFPPFPCRVITLGAPRPRVFFPPAGGGAFPPELFQRPDPTHRYRNGSHAGTYLQGVGPARGRADNHHSPITDHPTYLRERAHTAVSPHREPNSLCNAAIDSRATSCDAAKSTCPVQIANFSIVQ